MFLKLGCDINSDPCKGAVWRILSTTVWQIFKGSGKNSTWKKEWTFEGKDSLWLQDLKLHNGNTLPKFQAETRQGGGKCLLYWKPEETDPRDNRVMWETGHLSKIASSIQVLQLAIQWGSVSRILPSRI